MAGPEGAAAERGGATGHVYQGPMGTTVCARHCRCPRGGGGAGRGGSRHESRQRHGHRGPREGTSIPTVRRLVEAWRRGQRASLPADMLRAALRCADLRATCMPMAPWPSAVLRRGRKCAVAGRGYATGDGTHAYSATYSHWRRVWPCSGGAAERACLRPRGADAPLGPGVRRGTPPRLGRRPSGGRPLGPRSARGSPGMRCRDTMTTATILRIRTTNVQTTHQPVGDQQAYHQQAGRSGRFQREPCVVQCRGGQRARSGLPLGVFGPDGGG